MLPPPSTHRREDTDEKLPTWTGTPLDPENLGAHLEPGILFCQIGDPKELEAVHDHRSGRSEPHPARGRKVDIKIEGFPGTIHSEVAEIAGSELKVTPQRLSTRSGGELPTKTNPQTGTEKPISTSYQARAPIDDPDQAIRSGCGSGPSPHQMAAARLPACGG